MHETRTFYVDIESTYDIPLSSDTLRALHDRIEGRPIIIGLAIDVINNRIATVSDMRSLSPELNLSNIWSLKSINWKIRSTGLS